MTMTCYYLDEPPRLFQPFFNYLRINTFKHIATGAAVGIGWLVIGGILSRILIKHQKGFILFIIHGVVIAIIAFEIHSLTAYLWH